MPEEVSPDDIAPPGDEPDIRACVGGPLDGQYVPCRFPKGFLAVDKPAGLCWVYERVSEPAHERANWPHGEIWKCRDEAGEPPDFERRWKTAEGSGWDVYSVGV